jgi:hypothetical protein
MKQLYHKPPRGTAIAFTEIANEFRARSAAIWNLYRRFLKPRAARSRSRRLDALKGGCVVRLPYANASAHARTHVLAWGYCLRMRRQFHVTDRGELDADPREIFPQADVTLTGEERHHGRYAGAASSPRRKTEGRAPRCKGSAAATGLPAVRRGDRASAPAGVDQDLGAGLLQQCL